MTTFPPLDADILEGWKAITNARGLGKRKSFSAVSVVFAANARPTAADLRALSLRTGQFALGYDAGDEVQEECGWVELVASGLAYDCSGLAPGPSADMPERGHNFGIASDLDLSSGEAITLVPGPHLVGGAVMFPVVRVLAWLAAQLAELPGVQAVAWHGARSFSAPAHFRNGVMRWVEGGVFPGLGLTALIPVAEGGLASEGMALFTGQEIELAAELVEDRAEGAKLALRIIHWLVENGRIEVPALMTGPSGETLLLDPVNNQQIVKVSKS